MENSFSFWKSLGKIIQSISTLKQNIEARIQQVSFEMKYKKVIKMCAFVCFNFQNLNLCSAVVLASPNLFTMEIKG